MGKPDNTIEININCLLMTACGCTKWQLMPMDHVYMNADIVVLLPPKLPKMVNFEAELPPPNLRGSATRRFVFKSFEQLMGTTIAVYEETRDE